MQMQRRIDQPPTNSATVPFSNLQIGQLQIEMQAIDALEPVASNAKGQVGCSCGSQRSDNRAQRLHTYTRYP